MAKFQVMLGGKWEDYGDQEDKILKRAFMAGFPNAKYELRGQHYTYDFKRNKQINTDTKKERDIRAPHKWNQPEAPIVPAGQTTTYVVKKGEAGTTVLVKYPGRDDKRISVNVPATAKPGQAMLVPVPPADQCPDAAGAGGSAEPVKGGLLENPAKKKKGWSTGAKVAAGVTGAAVVGGGAALGVAIAEHGADETFTAIGDGLETAGEAVADVAEDAGEAIADAAEDAGDFIVDAAEDVGDFIMDLF
eukprot:TRINITY_DN756_c0_g1_i2.p2 TRINITY_DN756_c0_g1~~TRINITY_DN756_c0_g1_i2.p2  ORF type:complete len:247 (-),score=84.19 TRINITY_DN756_c0_g1_i2:107-847(-)